jgi:hypothetical protein
VLVVTSPGQAERRPPKRVCVNWHSGWTGRGTGSEDSEAQLQHTEADRAEAERQEREREATAVFPAANWFPRSDTGWPRRGDDEAMDSAACGDWNEEKNRAARRWWGSEASVQRVPSVAAARHNPEMRLLRAAMYADMHARAREGARRDMVAIQTPASLSHTPDACEAAHEVLGTSGGEGA